MPFWKLIAIDDQNMSSTDGKDFMDKVQEKIGTGKTLVKNDREIARITGCTMPIFPLPNQCKMTIFEGLFSTLKTGKNFLKSRRWTPVFKV